MSSLKSPPFPFQYRKKGRGGFARPVLAILDPPSNPKGTYDFKKDSSHLLLLALSRRGHDIFYADPSSLFAEKNRIKVVTRSVSVFESEPYLVFHDEEVFPADFFPLILMRKDPPVDIPYLYATYLLSMLSKKVFIINDPSALREWNEKLVILNFPAWIPPTIVSANKREIDNFVTQQKGTALLKGLAGFAGNEVKKIEREGEDYVSTIEEMTRGGSIPVMAQAFLPAIAKGEKRVFFIDGKPWGALLKVPPEGTFLSNPDQWSQGGHLAPAQLTGREKRICNTLSLFLRKNKIFFAGVDLIDQKLTEINITSPGLLWEWNEATNCRYEEKIVDLIEKKI